MSSRACSGPPSRPFSGSLLAPRRLAAAALLVLPTAGLVAVPQAQEAFPEPRGCATAVLAQQRLNRPDGFAGGRAASIQAATLSARTYATAHFVIHYTLAPNLHRVKLVAQDNALKAKVDSLRAALPNDLTTYKRDSTLHARLDAQAAPHPLYVQRTAQYFERAWAYYDSLGMRMPAYASTSAAFIAPSQGRYVVDIADVNAISGLSGAYYGLTYPPADGGQIVLENDFLHAASYNGANDAIEGRPVQAYYPASVVYRNYATDWELGLKVTAAHEFYHSVQYSYTPTLNNLHAWYELSATGMEERLAPEVNDYLQYLPYNVPNNHLKSLLVSNTDFANYGNGIFHSYLTRTLGAVFDTVLWAHLADTNNLPKALLKTAGSQARWDSLYAGYSAAMALSGTPAAAASPLAFSPDMAQWPRPRFDTVPASGGAQLTLPALTFRLVRPPASGNGLATQSGFAGAWRVDSSASGYLATFLAGGTHAVPAPAGGTKATLALANADFTLARQAALSKPGSGIMAARNPIVRTQGPVVFIAPLGGSTDTLHVVAESGRRVATLPPASGGASWSWDLKDPQARLVPAGLYFFGTVAIPAKPLLVLP